MWMDLESVIYGGKLSQKEKNKYHLLANIYVEARKWYR